MESARRALIAGDAARAEALLAPLLALQLRNPEWEWLMGRARELQGRLDGAESSYEAALLLDPLHAEAGRALQQIKALRWKPVMAAWHLYTAGRALEASHAFAAALHDTSTGAALKPEIWIGLGWCHHALADAASAAWCFRKATELEPGSARALLGHGIACYLGGWIDDAEASLAAAELANPAMHEAASFRGWCAYARLQYSEALGHFERAHKTQPLSADPLWGIAWSRSQLGEHGWQHFSAAVTAGVMHPARADLVNILAASAAADELRLLLATKLLDAGAPAEALPHANAALSRARAGAGVLSARALLQLRRHEESCALLADLDDLELDAAFDEQWADGDGILHPVSTTARELLARAENALGHPERALALARTCLARKPDHGAAALQLAAALAATGDPAAAREQLTCINHPQPLARAAADLQASLRVREEEPWFSALQAHIAGDDATAREHLAALPPDDPRRQHLESRWSAAPSPSSANSPITEPTLAEAKETHHRRHRP